MNREKPRNGNNERTRGDIKWGVVIEGRQGGSKKRKKWNKDVRKTREMKQTFSSIIIYI